MKKPNTKERAVNIVPKLNLKMKLTFLFLLAALFQINANLGYAQNTKISLNLKQTTLTEVFAEIESKTEFKFFFKNEDLDFNRRIDLKVKRKSIEAILERIFQRQNVAYEIYSKHIILKKLEEQPESKGGLALKADQLQVSGTVFDADGGPLLGANILEKGTSNGTQTDFDGNFTLNVADENAILVISYLGFITKEVTVGNQATINVQLENDSAKLDEVVVIGYGSQRKVEVTGSIASIGAEELAETPVDGFSRALAGKVAGLQIQQTSGAPGSNVSIRVRGIGSINASSEPLYVIDGVPIENRRIFSVNDGFDGNNIQDQGTNPLNSINPNDIESIQVLKDAASAAIYGSRGGNGVVLITTKRGKYGKMKVDFETSVGTQRVLKKLDLLDADGFRDLIADAYANSGRALPDVVTNPSNINTDWQDEIFRSATIRNYQLSVSGGNEKSNYFFSSSYGREDGIVINTGFERFTARANIESRPTDWLKVGLNITPSYTRTELLNVEGHWAEGAVVNSAAVYFPFLPPDADQEAFVNDSANDFRCCDIPNPIEVAQQTQGFSNQQRLLGNLYAELKLEQNLTLRTSMGVDVNNFRSDDFIPGAVRRGTPLSRGTSNSIDQRDWLLENILSYNRIFGENHTFTAIGGFSYQESDVTVSNIVGEDFPSDLVPTLNLANNVSAFTTQEKWALVSYLGRINYAYKNKYLFSVSARQDGSSRFGENNRYAFFPAVSAGWNIYNEPFLRDSKQISNLKLRASFGVTGNNNIGNYASIGLIENENYVVGSGNGAQVTGLIPSTISNPDLTWETTKQVDVGLELGFFKNRIFMVLDYYNSRTEDLLLQVQIPSVSGFTSSLQNIGEVSNEGLEIALSTENFVNDFKWSTNFNISFNQNEVLSLGPLERIFSNSSRSNTHLTEIGQPIGNFFGYQQEGVYNTQADADAGPQWSGGGSNAGDVHWRDVDDNGIINPDDRVILGNNIPDFIWGLNNTFSYKNFDLSILIDGVSGNEVFFSGRRFIEQREGNQNNLALVEDRWRSPSEPGNGIIPIASDRGRGGNNTDVQSRWVEDGSFTRIQNIALGYNFPENLVKNWFVSSLRIYVIAQNVALFTDYNGYNPEVSLLGGDPLSAGVDYGSYPLSRRIVFGVKLGL